MSMVSSVNSEAQSIGGHLRAVSVVETVAGASDLGHDLVLLFGANFSPIPSTLFRKRVKLGSGSVFVNISASWSCEETEISLILLLSTSSLTKWNLSAVVLVVLFMILLLAAEMVPSLSSKTLIGCQVAKYRVSLTQKTWPLCILR